MCDVCLKEKNASKTGSQAIINLLKEKKEATAKEMCTQLNLKEADILINLRYLLSEEIIGLNNYNQYFLRVMCGGNLSDNRKTVVLNVFTRTPSNR